jgi:hypothetical protein
MIHESKHINLTTKIGVCHPTCEIGYIYNFLFFLGLFRESLPLNKKI